MTDEETRLTRFLWRVLPVLAFLWAIIAFAMAALVFALLGNLVCEQLWCSP